MVFATDKSARTAVRRPTNAVTDFIRRTGLSDIYMSPPGSVLTVSVDKRAALYQGQVVFTRDAYPTRSSAWLFASADDTVNVTDLAIPASATGVAFVCSAITDAVVPRVGAAMAIQDANSVDNLTTNH